MAQNIIALIYPEYNDKGNPTTSSDWATDELYDDKTLGEQIKETGILVDFFKDEACQMFYDSKNVNACLYPVNFLPEFYPSRARQLRIALNEAKDWRKHRVSSGTEEYNIHYSTVKDEIRTEIASRQKSSANDSFIIATNRFCKECKSWELKKGDESFPVETVPMSIPEVFGWLSKHHKPLRKYEWNEKHGECGKGAHKDNKGEKVSVLLCSREHAAELLPIAIGEPMYDMLHCYDPKHNKYMEYKAGCKFLNLPSKTMERTYHSYHIHDESGIPKRVVYKITLLKNLVKNETDKPRS